MRGDCTTRDEPRVSAISGTVLIITLALAGLVLLAGASTALTAQEGDFEHNHNQTIGIGDGVDIGDGVEVGEHIDPGDLTHFVAEEPDVLDEEAADADSSLEITDNEIEIEVLTTQIGDVDAPRDPLDVVLVPEQSFAMHTFWGTHFPSSHTAEFIHQEQDVLTTHTGQELNDKSYTAIGDLLGISSVLSGPYGYQCELDEGGWLSSDEHWCGWQDTSSWYESSNPADATMYHINASKSFSIINGFDMSQDNWRYDTHVRSGGVDGEFVELTGSSEFYKEVDDYQEDEIYDHPDAAFLEDINIPLEDIYRLDYRFGSNDWGIDVEQGDAWVRMAYDGFLSEVDDNAPLDPFGYRFDAMESVTQVLTGAAGDQVALAPNGEIINDLEESFLHSELDLDDIDNADKLLNDNEFFNSTASEEELQQIMDDIEELSDTVSVEDYGEYNVWDHEDGDGGFAKALDELGTVHPDRQSDKHVVLVTGGQEPLRPQDSWYETVGDAILDSIPTFWGLLPELGFLDERPDPEEVGPVMDDHVVEMAQQANEEGVAVHTLGLGSGQDGFRLASIADAADDESDCLDDLSSSACNYEAVVDSANLEDALLEQLFDDDSLTYDVERPHTELSVAIDGQGTETLDLGNVNDPYYYRIEDILDTVSMEFDGVNYMDDIEFQADVSACAEPDEALLEQFDLTDTFQIQYQHYECESSGLNATAGTNYVFTDGDDLDQLTYTQLVDWTKDPADVIQDDYGHLVNDGTLDLADEDEGTEGAIVMVPVDVDTASAVNPQGYVLLHVEQDQLPDATHFEVEDVGVENADHVAYEDIDTGTETVVHAAGDGLDVDFDVTNLAQPGEETLTLETEDGKVLAHAERHLGTEQGWSDTFTWTPGEVDVGYHGHLVVSSQNTELKSDVKVEIKEPGSDVQVATVQPNDRIYLDLTGEDAEADEIGSDDTPVNFEADFNNVGPHKGTDEFVTLEIAEGVSKFTTDELSEIGAYGWNGTDPAGEPAFNQSLTFEEWQPGFEIVGSWDSDGVGGVEVPVTVQTDDDVYGFSIEVVYQVDPQTADSELDDVEDEDFDPVEIDIDEIELES